MDLKKYLVPKTKTIAEEFAALPPKKPPPPPPQPKRKYEAKKQRYDWGTVSLEQYAFVINCICIYYIIKKRTQRQRNKRKKLNTIKYQKMSKQWFLNI